MATVEQLTNKLQWARKQKAYAWAKYYEQVNGALHGDHVNRVVYERIVEDGGIPVHIKEEMKAMAVALKKKWECPVCLDMIEDGNLEITNCGHYYCKGCLTALQRQYKQQHPQEDKWKCAVCRRKSAYPEEEDDEDVPLAQLRRRGM
jgi:hypothetical protein